MDGRSRWGSPGVLYGQANAYVLRSLLAASVAEANGEISRFALLYLQHCLVGTPRASTRAKVVAGGTYARRSREEQLNMKRRIL